MATHNHVFECSCGTTRNSADHRVPVGWSTGLGSIFCPDCTAAGVPQRHYREAPARAARHRNVA